MINIRIPTSVSIKASHLEWILLVGVTLLAASLRFFRLDEWSFWIDEIHTINRAVWHYDPLSFFQFWTSLSIMLEAQALQFYGISEWSARLVPALIGVASIPILYLPTRRFFGPTTALIAALLLAVSPWHLFWSQNARFYTTLLLFYNLALFAFFIAIEEDRPLWLVIFFGLVWLAIRERTIAVFLIPVVVAYPIAVILLRFKQPRGLRLRNMLILLGPMVAVVLLDLANFLRGGGSFFLEQIEVVLEYTLVEPLRLVLSIAYRIGLPLIFLGLVGGLLALREKSRAGLFLVLGVIIPPLLLIGIAPYIYAKDRYVFPILHFCTILGAVALQKLIEHSRSKLLAASIILLVCLLSFSEIYLYFEHQHGWRANWRQAFAIVEQRLMPGDVIRSNTPEVGQYYLDRQDIIPLMIPPPEQEGRIWLIVDETHGIPNHLEELWLQDNAAFVAIVRNSLPGKSLDLRIYLAGMDSETGDSG